VVNWIETRVKRNVSLSSLSVFIIYNFKIKRRDLPYHSSVIQGIGVGGINVDFIAVIRSRISENSAQRHEESVLLVQLHRPSGLEI
jgi:hypothetical protein